MDFLLRSLAFLAGLALVLATCRSALSTFVVPRSVRSRLNRIVFGVVRRVFEIPIRFTRDFEGRDAIMAYYAPVALMLLVPVWYLLVSIGYTGVYWALGVDNWMAAFRLSG